MNKETEEKIIKWLENLAKEADQDLIDDYNKDPCAFYSGNEDDAIQLGENLSNAWLGIEAQQLLDLINGETNGTI